MSPILFSAILAAGFTLGTEHPQVCASKPLCRCSFFDVEPVAEQARVTTKVYSVTDLVTPVAQVVGESDEKTPPCGNLTEKLMELIVSTIAPETWSAKGGDGTMQYYPLGGALVVSQTAEVQEQIADLLEALRRLQEVEVAIELRILSVGRDFLDHADLGIQVTKSGPTFIDDKQVRQLLEAVQEDHSASVMQAPKVTIMNGQVAKVCVGQEYSYMTGLNVVSKHGEAVAIPKIEKFTSGVEFQIQPAVSADQKNVTVGFTGKITDHDPNDVAVVPVITALTAHDGCGEKRIVPVTQFVQLPKFQTMEIRKSFQVGDGKTAVLLWGTHMVDCRDDVDIDVPVLGSVPFVNRLFSAMTWHRAPQDVILLVTPRVIISEEDERLSPAEEKPW
jgi:general secretion pathway protein D